jgi:predicted nucleotidyltransferase
MRAIETADVGESLPLDALQSVLGDHPIRLAVLFGSYATDRIHARSGVDIAVEFENLRPGDDSYNKGFLGLGADVSEALGTDDVDLLDVHALSASLARSVFEEGVLIIGEPERVQALRQRLVDDERDERSPRRELDESLQRTDEHLA